MPKRFTPKSPTVSLRISFKQDDILRSRLGPRERSDAFRPYVDAHLKALEDDPSRDPLKPIWDVNLASKSSFWSGLASTEFQEIIQESNELYLSIFDLSQLMNTSNGTALSERRWAWKKDQITHIFIPSVNENEETSGLDISDENYIAIKRLFRTPTEWINSIGLHSKRFYVSAIAPHLVEYFCLVSERAAIFDKALFSWGVKLADGIQVLEQQNSSFVASALASAREFALSLRETGSPFIIDGSKKPGLLEDQ